MVELKTYKYKLYNRDALKYLDGILVIAGRIYNHCIALHRRYYGIYHKMLDKYQLQKHLTKLKRQYPEWNEVPSQAIQDITDRIDRAYHLFFSNLKAGKTVMYADKYYPSSQLCSECGYQNHLLKDVSIREWTCPVCGCHHDRDLNAARNLCKVGASTFGICCSP